MRSTYSIYGLRLSSEVRLPELSETIDEGPSDIYISLGSISSDLSRSGRDDNGFVVVGDAIFLDIPGVATFSIRDGASIEVVRYPSSTEVQVRLFLLGSVMGALLHQRGLMPFHAGSIGVEGYGVAFSADSGGGKSTLTALFAQRGYQVNGDDVAALELAPTNEVLLRSAPARIRLMPDALEALGKSSKLELQDQGIDRKFEILTWPREAQRALPLNRIYFLEFDEAADSMPHIEPMGKYAAFVAFRSNIYRSSLIGSLGKERKFLEWTSRALATVACYRLRRPKDLSRLGDIGDILELHWRGISRLHGRRPLCSK
ncbi:MAG TPA: hypothetical protein VM163_03715 [bacterium]|nr:hypothetical protein [bacterium]